MVFKECQRCEYKWITKLKNPKVCPRCKSYKYNTKPYWKMKFSKTEIEGKRKDGSYILGKTTELKQPEY